MTFDGYQKASARTINTDLDYQDQLANAGLGISDEAGEVAGLVKKMLFQGHPANPVLIADEMGDVLWYLALLATTMGFSLGDVAAANVKKLEQRYPRGFRAADSVNRGPGES